VNAQSSVSSAASLQALFVVPVDTVELVLQRGDYHLVPSPLMDSTCGNCEDPAILVESTVGLHIRGTFVRISGPTDKSAIIHTNAGYGLFFDRCRKAVLENVTISGGERDTNGNASDAAIVIKNSTVLIRNSIITNNIGDPAEVARNIVGIMGICCRERSDVTISGNEITRNSWDGIALYRDAVAIIEDNVIDGVDKAQGARVGGGRGVGIGVTWNGKAIIRRNLVTHYWKGIGLFVNANGIVENNIVEDVITWGIAFWDAGKGKPVGVIENNVIYKTGACGASITRTEQGDHPGRFVDNIIVETGQNPKYDSPDYYCYQCALALHAVPAGFVVEENLFFNNRRATPNLPDNDEPKEEFTREVQQRCHTFASYAAFRRSLFLKTFCGTP